MGKGAPLADATATPRTGNQRSTDGDAAAVDHPFFSRQRRGPPATEASRSHQPPTTGNRAPDACAGGGRAVRDQGEDVIFAFGDRRYRVRGLAKNTAFDSLKVNLLAGRGDHFHVDTLDLYGARQRRRSF